MKEIVQVDDREFIERFARRDPGLHLYELGDLDPFFWQYAVWFGLPRDNGEFAALVLLYTGASMPTSCELRLQPA